MSTTIGYAIPATLLLGVGIARLRAYLTTRRPETGYLAVGLFALAISLFFSVSPAITWLDQQVWHRANLTALLSSLSGVASAAASVELVVASSTGTLRASQRARIAGFCVAATLMIFFFARAQPMPEAPRFFEAYAQDSRLLAFWITLIGTLIVGSIYVALVSVRTARIKDVWLSRGLRLISIGAAAAGIFLLTRLVALGNVQLRWLEGLAMSSLVLSSCLIALGALLPAAAARWRRARALREIGNLWEVVTAEFPEVRADRHRGRRPRSLYRAVIEIQDAVSEARERDQISDDVMHALDLVPARAADEQDALIDDLLRVAAGHAEAIT